MRVIILNYEYPPLGGGAANATKYILKEFSKYENLEIDLITSSTNKFKVEKISRNITIHYLNINKKNKNIHTQSNKDLLIYSLKAYFYTIKLRIKKKYDFIHAFFGIPGGFIAMLQFKPYIVSLRGSDVPFYSKKYELLDKLFFKWLSKVIWFFARDVISNSKGLKELAKKTSKKQKIGIIYNGIDTTEFITKKQNENKQTNTKNKKLKILCVGRLIERKGYKYLIDAIEPIKDKIRIDFIGEGPSKGELKKKSIGLNIKFLGIIEHDKLSKIYPNYDIFILPSFNEGMSNTVLEAMAAGLGIIVTDTGGTSELIKNNGFIVKTANSKEITKAIQKYLNDKNVLKIHSKKSRELAEKMSWETVAKKYYEYYEKIN
ncbi:MAG: glycosyltransferase family 4 protein [Candidatus Woesearchaeota archaeon]|jgi:glycosyltransferase involved in cell wall biosynthesis|nr:glycosyltransferase family 4 protein [Candidatus Woesearchaeota archaeon]